MNSLRWDTRGLGNCDKDYIIKDIIRNHSIDMVGLTLTKLQSVDLMRIVSIWGPTAYLYLHCNASLCKWGLFSKIALKGNDGSSIGSVL